MTIDNEDEKCLDCILTITVKPSMYASEISAAFTSQTSLNSNLDQHIYKPTRWVSFSKLRAIECKMMNVEKEMVWWFFFNWNTNQIWMMTHIYIFFFKGG